MSTLIAQELAETDRRGDEEPGRRGDRELQAQRPALRCGPGVGHAGVDAGQDRRLPSRPCDDPMAYSAT